MKDEPIILITEPEVITIECEKSLMKKDIFNYENSHVIYKGKDLGSFKELIELKQKADRVDKAIEFIDNSVIYTYLESYEEYESDYSLDNEQVFELLNILRSK